MLDVLHRLFKNGGRSWHIYQRVAEALNLVPLRFTRVVGTRFQPHTLSVLSSFLQKFLITMLFARNVEEQGSGKESLVTKEMYSEIIGFKKKWRELKFLASANTFFPVLIETAHLSYLMEGDTAMIYQFHEAIDDAILNLKDIAEEKDTPLFPANVKLIKETEESENVLMANTTTVSVSASNVPENEFKKIRKSKSSNEPKVTVVKETLCYTT